VQAAGKKHYYNQIEKSITAASDDMEKAMLDNLKYVDTQHGINAFLEKKKPVWSHTDAKVE
jgi:enoyl-CoA hydratase/carnithine racemase